MKFYAVLYQDQNMIFESWEECQTYLKDKKGYHFKSFQTLEEAQRYLNPIFEKPSYIEPTAFIDGSYHKETNEYSFGGVLLIDGKIYQFKKKYEPDQFSVARNVAGEIKGAGYIINYACKQGIKELHLYYDYIGIEKWYTGEWKAKSEIAQKYVAFISNMKDQIKLHFHKVKSHTNNYYNDLADQLAKEALNL